MVALNFAKYTLLCHGNKPHTVTKPDLTCVTSRCQSDRHYYVGTKKYVKTMPANGENSAQNPPSSRDTLAFLFAVSIFKLPLPYPGLRSTTALIEWPNPFPGATTRSAKLGVDSLNHPTQLDRCQIEVDYLCDDDGDGGHPPIETLGSTVFFLLNPWELMEIDGHCAYQVSRGGGGGVTLTRLHMALGTRFMVILWGTTPWQIELQMRTFMVRTTMTWNDFGREILVRLNSLA